jgi:hypothetical protein
MTYPIIKTHKARALGDAIDAQAPSDPDMLVTLNHGDFPEYIEYREGASFDLDLFNKNAADFTHQERLTYFQAKKVGERVSNAELEQRFAIHLFDSLRGQDAALLQDPDFWRYLTLFPYRWYTFTREGNMKPGRYGGDGDRQKTRWTLIRAYLWAAKTVKEGDVSYVTRISDARHEAGLSDGWVIDYYSNNVVRGPMTNSPSVCRALIDAVVSEPALFDQSNDDRPTAELGQRVRRLSGNIYFASLQEAELVEIFKNEKEYIQK